ncbi:MAG: histone deacetylase family protein, partial [candidate division WOR-3 bacterium]
MKIVYHQKFREVYSTDPASSPGRIEAIMDELDGRYPIVEAEPAKMEDLMTVHSRTHIERIKKDPHLFEIASL